MTQINASVFSNGTWQNVQTISNSAANLQFPSVAMYKTGYSVAVWLNETSNTIESAVFNGSVWTSVATDAIDCVSKPSLATNSVGQAILGYSTSTGFAYSAFFNGSAWINLTQISPTNDVQLGASVPVSINSSGNASAAWTTSLNQIEAALFSGGIWRAPQVISNTSLNSSPAIGIDAQGNVQAIWLSESVDMDTATYNGIVWSTATPLFVNVDGNFLPVLAVAPNGVAVALCLDTSDNVAAATYSGSAWSASQIISSFPAAGSDRQPQVAIDPSSNAYAIWPVNSGNTHQILSSFFTNGTWGTPQIVVNADVQVDGEQIAVSPNHAVFAVWQTDISGAGNIFASIYDLSPLPPAAFSGRVVKDKFLSQTDRIHQLMWTPPNDPTVINYLLTRNGILIATIPSTQPPVYLDHNRSKRYADVYTLTSENAGGAQSQSLSVTLQ